MTTSALPRWLRGSGFALSFALVVASALVLYVDGRLPAAVLAEAPDYTTVDLLAALSAVESSGRVDVTALRNGRAALDRFIAAMAKTSPATTPERFPTPEDRVAFWLNAAHALVLQQLLDTPTARTADELSRWQSWPIGGERLTRAAIERRFLAESGSPCSMAPARVASSTARPLGPTRSTRSSTTLPGASFAGATRSCSRRRSSASRPA
jgi:hypothetical protein